MMVVMGTDGLLAMARQLKNEGKISVEQYAGMLRRSASIPAAKKRTIIIR